MADERHDTGMDVIGRDQCCNLLHCLVLPAEYVCGDGVSQRTPAVRGCPALWGPALHPVIRAGTCFAPAGVAGIPAPWPSGDVCLLDPLPAAYVLGAHRAQARDGEPDERRSRSNQRHHHRSRDHGAGRGVGQMADSTTEVNLINKIA